MRAGSYKDILSYGTGRDRLSEKSFGLAATVKLDIMPLFGGHGDQTKRGDSLKGE